ncbi:MAG: hypothetical protein ACM3SU_15990 [Acidobacteriota bacterium]
MNRNLTAVPALLLILAVAALYVFVAWRVARRFGRRSLLAVWLGATAIVAAAAAVGRGVASADELLLARPSNAWTEAALLTALIALPGFGLAARSVSKRFARQPAGPRFADWAAGLGAALVGALVPAIALTAWVLIFWP